MKAITITGERMVSTTELKKPTINPHEVLVKIAYVGFCGSYLTTYLVKNPIVKLPVIPGHEIVAVVESIGD